MPRTTDRNALKTALCIAAGIMVGLLLLADVPLKWKIAVLAVPGSVIAASYEGSLKRVLLGMLAFFVPINFGKDLILRSGHLGLSVGTGIKMTDVLALALLLIFLSDLARREGEVKSFAFMAIPALAWVLFSVLSLFSAKDAELVVMQLINMGKLLLLSWIIANSVRFKADIRIVLVGMLLGVLFQATVGVYQGISGRPLGVGFLTETTEVQREELSVGLAYRVQGTMPHPNAYATYIVSVLPFALGLLLAKVKPLIKALAGLALCLGFVAVILALSRSSWINFMVMIGLVIMLAIRHKRVRAKTAMLIVGAASLVLLGLAFLGPEMVLSRLTGPDQGSARSRITLAQTAVTIIKDHPWVGIGLNNYSLASPQYGSTVMGREYNVHNAYLLIAAETGLLGLASFLAFLSVLLVNAWRIIKQVSDEVAWVAGVGTFSALVALSIHSLWDYGLLSSLTTQFWFLAGLCAGLTNFIDRKMNGGPFSCPS